MINSFWQPKDPLKEKYRYQRFNLMNVSISSGLIQMSLTILLQSLSSNILPCLLVCLAHYLAQKIIIEKQLKYALAACVFHLASNWAYFVIETLINFREKVISIKFCPAGLNMML